MLSRVREVRAWIWPGATYLDQLGWKGTTKVTLMMWPSVFPRCLSTTPRSQVKSLSLATGGTVHPHTLTQPFLTGHVPVSNPHAYHHEPGGRRTWAPARLQRDEGESCSPGKAPSPSFSSEHPRTPHSQERWGSIQLGRSSKQACAAEPPGRGWGGKQKHPVRFFENVCTLTKKYV